MGVPLFCILLGLPAGWYIARRIAASPFDAGGMLSRMRLGAAVTSAVTVIGMAALWGPWIPMLFDPAADLSLLGAPLRVRPFADGSGERIAYDRPDRTGPRGILARAGRSASLGDHPGG